MINNTSCSIYCNFIEQKKIIVENYKFKLKFILWSVCLPAVYFDIYLTFTKIHYTLIWVHLRTCKHMSIHLCMYICDAFTCNY